jgi:hypothetical protein
MLLSGKSQILQENTCVLPLIVPKRDWPEPSSMVSLRSPVGTNSCIDLPALGG